jgi:predicted nucleic acid-binding protein
MLVDTSGLLCYFDASDPRHEDASILFEAATLRLTHNYILAEFVPLCLSRRLPRASTLAFCASLLDAPNVTVIWVDRTTHNTAMQLLETQLDKAYSLCDAVSLTLMKQFDVTEALTTDRHFEQAGYHRLLAP